MSKELTKNQQFRATNCFGFFLEGKRRWQGSGFDCESHLLIRVPYAVEMPSPRPKYLLSISGNADIESYGRPFFPSYSASHLGIGSR